MRLRLACLLPLLAFAAAADEAALVERASEASFSPVVKGGFGLGLIGYDLVAELGFESLGHEVLADRWLLQWDALLAFRTAVLANTWPLTGFYGAASHGFVELGTRFQPAQVWSPYLGARVGSIASAIAHPGTALIAVNTLNANDGFGGLAVEGTGRVAAGASRLEGGNALLLTAFVQEALFAAGAVLPGLALTEVGLNGRLDLHRHLTVTLEALVGFAPTRANTGLQLTDQKTRLQFSAGVRKTFSNGVWLAFAASYARDSDRTVYTRTNTVYESAHAGLTTSTMSLGIPLWSQR
jgi:hypothetical protein